MPLSVLVGIASASEHGNEGPMRVATSAGNNRCRLIGRRLWPEGRSGMREVPASPLSFSPTFDESSVIRSLKNTPVRPKLQQPLELGRPRLLRPAPGLHDSRLSALHQCRIAALSQGVWRLRVLRPMRSEDRSVSGGIRDRVLWPSPRPGVHRKGGRPSCTRVFARSPGRPALAGGWRRQGSWATSAPARRRAPRRDRGLALTYP